jgi:hypothetical protein
MADRCAIENTLSSWALGYDQREPKRMERCFTPDAELIMDISGTEKMGPYIGRDEVMKHFLDHHAIQIDQRRHITTNVVIDEETEDTASVVSCLTLLVTEGNSIRLQASGLYRDNFVKSESGWQISRRRIELDTHF